MPAWIIPIDTAHHESFHGVSFQPHDRCHPAHWEMSVTFSFCSTGADFWPFSSLPASPQLILWGMIAREVDSNVCICVIVMNCRLAICPDKNIASTPHYLCNKSAAGFAC